MKTGMRRLLGWLLVLALTVGLLPAGALAAKEQFTRTNELSENDFLVYVEDVFTITGRGTVITGRVVSGIVRVNDPVVLHSYDPSSREIRMISTTVKGIEMFHKTLEEAQAGDNVGIQLDGVAAADVQRGDALTHLDTPLYPTDGDIIGTVTLGDGQYNTLTDGERYSLYWKTDAVGTLDLGGSDMAPKETRPYVTVRNMARPVTWYVGQEIKIRAGGRELGTFTVTGIQSTLVRHWDFEFDESISGWTFTDADGDGSGWIRQEDSSYAYNGVQYLISYSWDILRNQKMAPDNWAVSPAVELPRGMVPTLTFQARTAVEGKEQVEVYAGTSPDPSTMTRVMEAAEVGNAYTGLKVDLSAFAGQTVYLAFRHTTTAAYGRALYIDAVDLRLTGPIPVDLAGICCFDMAKEVTGQAVMFSTESPDQYLDSTETFNAYGAVTVRNVLMGYDQDDNRFFFHANDAAETVYPGAKSPSKVVTLAYDYQTHRLYGLRVGSSDGRILFRADPATGEVEDIATYEQTLNTLAIDGQGVGYGVEMNTGILYRLDLATGGITEVGPTGLSPNYVQDMTYHPVTGMLYWAFLKDEETNGLYLVDPDTAAVTRLGRIGPKGMEIVGLSPVYTDDSEPEVPTAVSGVVAPVTEVTVDVSESYHLEAYVMPAYADDRTVTWSARDPRVAYVTEDGWITGQAPGTTEMIATSADGGYTAIVTVTVQQARGELLKGFGFEQDPAEEGWTFVDADGDGFNWYWDDTPYEGSYGLRSDSYDDVNNKGLSPDNWAISPAVELPADGALCVTLCASALHKIYYEDHFALYAGTTRNVLEMTRISGEEDWLPAEDRKWNDYRADLTAFAGQTVYLAVRHYNVTDEYAIAIDAVKVWYNSDPVPPAPELAYGDVNADSAVNAADALLALQHSVKLITLTGGQKRIADVSGDGAVNASDALLILQKSVKLIDVFPVEKK